jgi:hypothetical protein
MHVNVSEVTFEYDFGSIMGRMILEQEGEMCDDHD